MIAVNLLPEEWRSKKKEFDFPIFPLLFLGFVLLMLIFLLLRIQIFLTQQVVKDIQLDLQSVQTKSLEAGKLKDNIIQMSSLLETVVFKGLLPEYSLALILNEINKTVPEGMWLREFHFYSEGSQEFLRLEGFIRPIGSGTMIASIGQFNDTLKDYLVRLRQAVPALLTKETSPLGQVLTEREVDFSITTRRRTADKLEITEFVTVFEL